MNALWSTTVTELLGLLRQALVALVPVAEKAKMAWRDGEAYDDWDAIASCLYDNLVVRTISCATEIGREVKLPKYDIVYPSYTGAFIQVEGEGVPEGATAVFVGFAGTSSDFTSVKWIKVLPSGDVPEQKIQYSPHDVCRFCLVLCGGNERTRVHGLTLEI